MVAAASAAVSLGVFSACARPVPPLVSSSSSPLSCRRRMRRSLEFQWFLIALSLRPGSIVAILAHLVPISCTSSTSFWSSASVHSSLLTEGHTWWCHLRARRKVLLWAVEAGMHAFTLATRRLCVSWCVGVGGEHLSLHCLPTLPGSLSAIMAHACVPSSFTSCSSLWSSAVVHPPPAGTLPGAAPTCAKPATSWGTGPPAPPVLVPARLAACTAAAAGHLCACIFPSCVGGNCSVGATAWWPLDKSTTGSQIDEMADSVLPQTGAAATTPNRASGIAAFG